MAVLAQSPANRTAQTIVADVLAQMPAQETDRYNTLMNDLATAGEEAVFQLVKMMNAPGKGSNAQVEFALSGLSHFVSAEDKEVQRLKISNAYIKALDMVSDREIKAFIIRQLQIAGKDEAIGKLATFINDESLSGPAVRALVSINTAEACKELLDGLSATKDDKSKKNIITGLAEMKVPAAEAKLLPLLNTGDDDMQKTVLHALSRIGSSASLKGLSAAAEKAGFAMEKTGATEAYIALIKRILKQGNTKEAEKAAADLMKKAEKAGQRHAREAALEIQMAAKPADVLKLLQNALKDNDRNYRFAALNFTSDYANGLLFRDFLKTLPKAKAEVKLDITNWLSQECENKNKRELIGHFATELLIEQMKTDDRPLKAASMLVLAKAGGHKGILALTGMLGSDNKENVQMAQEALYFTKGDIATAIAPVMANATDDGKIAALKLLAARKAVKYGNIAFDLLETGSPQVKTAAYTALKDLVSAKDADKLFTLLENASPEFVPQMQQAVISALSEYPADKQAAFAIERMNKGDQGKKQLYYAVLSATGDAGALKIITEGFNKESGAAKDAAFEALLGWKDIKVADQLYAISKDATASAYFDRALNRYITLVSDPKLSGADRFKYLNKAIDLAKTDNQKKAIITQLGRTNTYTGMVLAGKYLDDKPVQQAAAQAVMAIALANKDFTGKNVEELLNKVSAVLDNPDVEYQRQAIRDHLAGLVIPEPFVLTDDENKEGYRILFDGTNMDQWTGNTVDYIVENGCISLHPSNAHGGNLYTKEEFGNFIIRFEFQLTPAANNGLGIRTPMGVDAAYHGMELQILDNEAPVYSKLAEYQYHGSVYGIIPAKRGYLKPTGEWNYQEVIANGDNIKVILNGEVILDGNIRKATKNGMPDKKNHPGLFNKKGHIGFLGHGSPVKFKNIRIKVLD